MAITLNTPIVGKNGTARTVYNYLQFVSPITPAPGTSAFLAELERCCNEDHIRFDIAAPHSALETRDWDSNNPRMANWNPAGLLIEADDDPDPAKFTPVEAARIYTWALWVATGHDPDSTSFTLPASAKAFRIHWLAKYADPACPTVVTVADLAKRYIDRKGEPQACWMWDPKGPAKIVAKSVLIFAGAIPMAAYGNVKHPAYIDRLIPDTQNRAWNDLGPRRQLGVCRHTMVGTLPGTDGWFRRGAASTGLTDYSVDLNGTIYR